MILEIIQNESKLVSGMDRIIIGGISQGCATAIIALVCGGYEGGGEGGGEKQRECSGTRGPGDEIKAGRPLLSSSNLS